MLYLIGLIRLDNECVQVSVDIILWSDFLLDQVVLGLVAEDHMNFLVAGTTNVRTYKAKQCP